jgi:hypothetical protein
MIAAGGKEQRPGIALDHDVETEPRVIELAGVR